MTISVVVPTFKRPADLERCLLAVSVQTRLADETVVVVRNEDLATQELLSRLNSNLRTRLRLREVVVTKSGQVHALNSALASLSTDIMAITDDDATPYVDWLERIEKHFQAREEVGGVGGRDMLYDNGRLHVGEAAVVGVMRFGRKHVGNHHLGIGPARDVDILKGVNSSYRTVAIRPVGFDDRLRGTGAQVHWEVSLGLQLKLLGWHLVYDPRILVNHYTASRHDEDQRATFNHVATKNSAYNEALIRLEHGTFVARVAFIVWSFLVGSRMTPGLVQIIRLYRTQGLTVVRRAAAVAEGRFSASMALAFKRVTLKMPNVKSAESSTEASSPER